ncbi:hypothetical protein BGY98DRAFT_998222 [Russula aff. rugulosa BPL654]|nr:hypothetical protein BGY98DRAFT_998222 [Russula aff. rugulosa BPL654]
MKIYLKFSVFSTPTILKVGLLYSTILWLVTTESPYFIAVIGAGIGGLVLARVL